MQFRRESYKSGEDTLVYGAVDLGASVVEARVYVPTRSRPNTIKLTKLEPGVFILDFNFREVGNYIFVVVEDGEVKTILNAKVYA